MLLELTVYGKGNVFHYIGKHFNEWIFLLNRMVLPPKCQLIQGYRVYNDKVFLFWVSLCIYTNITHAVSIIGRVCCCDSHHRVPPPPHTIGEFIFTSLIQWLAWEVTHFKNWNGWLCYQSKPWSDKIPSACSCLDVSLFGGPTTVWSRVSLPNSSKKQRVLHSEATVS